MPKCSRNGCRKEFEADAKETCVYHPGAPVFHEGLKSWSCCADINKPVLSFDDFMGISGCSLADQHTIEAPQPQAQKIPTKIPAAVLKPGVEVHGIAPKAVDDLTPQITSAAMPPPVVEEDEEDLTISVAQGTICKRKGCGVAFVSDEVNRLGDGEGTICSYHPKQPLFREGSKGYLCCKRRVLEFEEFLKIPGCKTGRHVFAPRKKSSILTPIQGEEPASCRIDHYQTPTQVHVSIFAKRADQERSIVKFEQHSVTVDLHLPGMKRFYRVLDLFGPIDPARSSVQFLNTKVELNLRKQDTRSWILLEKSNRDLGNINLTFGVGGRTGTVGAKQPILDDANGGQV
ncbi:chord-domain-containing protein [Amanita rubescens]|nr:chord-domain-containing protein [Amanita rubescens]